MAASVDASVTRRATRSITPDLLSIQIATPEPLPDGGQVFRHPAAAGQQAAHRVGLVAQQQREFIGDEFAGLRPARPGWAAVGLLVGDPAIGVAHRRLGQPRLCFRSVPACSSHRRPRQGCAGWTIPVMDSSSQQPLTLSNTRANRQM